MQSIKLRNIFCSLIALAVWASIILLLSRNGPDPGDISVFYLWARLTSLIAGIGAILLVCFRIFKVIDKNTNFLYSLFGLTNTIIGICGIGFYFFNKINRIGLHDLLANLLIGTVMLVDIFLFDTLIRKDTSEKGGEHSGIP